MESSFPSEGDLIGELKRRLLAGTHPWKALALLAIEYGLITRPTSLPDQPDGSMALAWLIELTTPARTHGKARARVENIEDKYAMRGDGDQRTRAFEILADNIAMYLQEGARGRRLIAA